MVVLWLPPTLAQRQGTAPAPAQLHIVVLEGEDAVNVIQQKTAVAPVVEVRDRNDMPVAGAVVRFAIRSGRARFAAGARSLTVTTNSAGRAVATGLSPTGTGAVEIGATASVGGQAAAAITIAQTNVATAADAAALAGAAAGSAGAAGGSGGAAAGAGTAAGTGGGLSATTLGLIGGAVAGGAFAVDKAIGGQGKTLTGSYSGSILMVVAGNPGCSFVEQLSGTVDITLDDPSTAAGRVEVSEQSVITTTSCGNQGLTANDNASGTLAGSPNNLTFAVQSTNPLPSGSRVKPWSFVGQLSGNVITGQLTTGDINQSTTGQTIQGSSTIPITIQ